MNTRSIRFRNESTGQTRIVHSAELHAHWDQLPPQVKVYIGRRELRRHHVKIIQVSLSDYQFTTTMRSLGRPE